MNGPVRLLYCGPLAAMMLTASVDGRQLVTARFFFWKPGGELQNTLTGLKRTFLHDILHDCPDLVPNVVPQLWERCKAVPWQAGDANFEVSRSEVDGAFDNLRAHTAKSEHRCFCIFIDGLDEFVGIPGCDTRDMLDELCGWTRQSSQVKLCVSSRPDNFFMNAFDPRQQIKLHDLTKGDMQAYIRAQLDHMESLETREMIVELVVNKAQGIFLWVTLAVKSIREQMEHGFSPAEMIRNVRLLPTELEELFKHILDSLTAPGKGYCTLVMVKLGMEYDIKLPLYSYSFFDDYEQDHRFAFNLQIRELQAPSVSADQDYIQAARQKLRGYCGGLIEDVRDTKWDAHVDWVGESFGAAGEPAAEFNAEFTHRSIPEFLEKSDMQPRIEKYTRHFSAADCLSQLFLATLKLRENGDNRDSPRKRLAPSLVYQTQQLLRLRHELGLDVAPFEFWEHFEHVQGQRYSQYAINWETTNMLVMEFGVQHAYRVISYRAGLDELESDKMAAYKWLNFPRFEALLPPVYIAAYLGFGNYPLWKLQSGSRVLVEDSMNLNLIAHLALQRDYFLGPEPQCVAIIEFLRELVRQGHLNIHTTTDFWIRDMLELRQPPAIINIWHQYILRLMTEEASMMIAPTAAQMPCGSYLERMSPDIIEMFLLLGGSPHLSMSWRPRSVEREHVSEGRGTGSPYTMFYMDVDALSNGTLLSVQTHRPRFDEMDENIKMHKEIGNNYTLRQWVSKWPDHVTKKRNILRLIDQNSHPHFRPSPQLSDEKLSDDTMRGSSCPSSNGEDPEASSLLDMPYKVEAESEEIIRTTMSKTTELSRHKLKSTRENMTSTVAMFLLGTDIQFLCIFTLNHYLYADFHLGVITTIFLQLFLERAPVLFFS